MKSLNQNKFSYLSSALIMLACMVLVAIVTWFAPALSSASANLLFRLRGELDPPEEILIVAIDDRSLQQIGRWPWPRSVMANALQRISAGQPRSVGLDIIYAEPSNESDDRLLLEAVRKSGRVVLPAQLITSGEQSFSDGVVTWLRPVFDDVAAVGHAHVSPDVDGTLRAIQLSKSDDQGARLWAFALEVVRVAEGFGPADFEERSGLLRFGPYDIALRNEESVGTETSGVQWRRSNEMLINYAGPSATFRRYSIVELLDGQIPPAALKDKIVLVGAVATSMSDMRVSPFMHYGARQPQGGQEMPGVEVHANVINTIRQRLWLKQVPESYAFLLALGIIFLTGLIVSRLDGKNQLVGLAMLLLTILCGSFFAFKRFMVVPPLPGMLVGFGTVIPLLLSRTLNASQRLDMKIAALAQTQKGFLLDDEDTSSAENRAQWLNLPRDLAWKLRTVDNITERLLARMSFMDRVLSGMGEGVLVCDHTERIVFANRKASQALGTLPQELLGARLSASFVRSSIVTEAELAEALSETARGKIFQREFTAKGREAKAHYVLQLSAIMGNGEAESRVASQARGDSTTSPSAEVIGFVTLITDTTRQVELEQMRVETLQLVSHELRTPLTSIQGLSDVLLKFPVETDQAREMVVTIHSEALRLSETVNRYLDLSRLESGAQPLKITSVRPEELIANSIRLHQPVASVRGIRILQSAPPLPAIAADAHLLSQALNNLLGNALKYGPESSAVLVEAKSDGVSLFVAVRDQGPGIPLDQCERVFEKFYRLERDELSGVVGTGLGLPLVKEIIERHGGRIQVDSVPNVGTTFTLELPLRSVP